MSFVAVPPANDVTRKRRHSPTPFTEARLNHNVADFMSQNIEKRRRVDDSSQEESDSDDDDDAPDTSPAEAGVIEKITLHNFMCHEKFELELGPQLNFIIGRNGSGKSAILTGISVGLGAKAADTNRGSSIVDLIQDGKSTARVSIVMRNEGLDSFEPETYGRKIIVERTLKRQGQNSYAIRGTKSNTVISRKKSTVDEILKKFNITVDNPLAFLSQDKAREFLTSASDHAKYSFFMEGSLLTDILKSLQESLDNIKNVRERLTTAEDAKKAATEKYNDAVTVYERHKKSDTLRKQSKLIHGKILWYNVTKIEATIAKHERIVAECTRQIADSEAAVAEKEKLIEQLTQQKTEVDSKAKTLRAEYRGLADQSDAKREVAEKMGKGMEQKKQAIENSEKETVDHDKTLEELNSQVADEQKRIDELKGGSKEALLNKKAELKELLDKLKDQRQECRTKIDNFEVSSDELTAANDTLSDIEQNLAALNDRKFTIKSSRGDKYIPWGANMRSVIEEVARESRWHKKPLGPIGTYVQVKDTFSKWKDLINAVLNKSLDSFLVYDEHDRRLLSAILRKNRLSKNIITRKFEKFDYEQGKAAHTTLVDMLHVGNEHVLYTLVDINNIEKCIIADNPSMAGQLVSQRNVMNVFTLFSSTSGQRASGEANSLRFDPIYYNNSVPHKLSNVSVNGDDLSSLEEQIRDENFKKGEVARQIRTIKMELQQKKRDHEKHYRVLSEKIRDTDKKIFEIDSSLDDEAGLGKIRNLEVQIQQITKQKETCQNIVNSLSEDLANDAEKFSVIKGEYRKLKSDQKNAKHLMEQAEQKLTELEDAGELAKSEIVKAHEAQARDKDRSKTSETKLESYREQCTNLRQEAVTFCAFEEVSITENDTSESIKKEFEDINNIIREAEAAIGQPFEVVQKQLLETKQVHENTEEIVSNLTEIYKRLTTDFNNRTSYLTTTILKNCREASASFEQSLAYRGFKGELEVDFTSKTLRMLVQTKTDKDMRTVESLSGGEKSFTQIALLVAIWKLMDSKVRGLDEFDVFMDSINRTMGIRLLLKELRAYPKSQSIFITPQEITLMGELVGDDVQIHRMSSPRDD